MRVFHPNKAEFSILWLLVLLAGVLLPRDPAAAFGSWSQPFQLNDELAATPFVVTDVSGGVHVFWGSEGQDGQSGAIFYRRMVNGVWSDAVDIQAAPNRGEAVYPSAVIDARGFIHLVWVSDRLYYSQVHLSEALSPRSWSTPYQMTNYSADNTVMRLGMDGSLNVLFSSQGATPAVYFLKSEDGGEFWRVAVQVSVPQSGAYALTCSLAVDLQGGLHAAWAEAVQSFAQVEGVISAPAAGVYYADSPDGGANWSYPKTIAAGEMSEPAVGVDGQNRIHLLWSGSGASAGQYHTYREVDQEEWHKMEHLLPGGTGLLGPSGLSLDSAGYLYAAVAMSGQSAFSQSSGEIMVISWRAGRWRDISQPSFSLIAPGVEHAQPSMAISQGNSMHLVWLAIEQQEDPEAEPITRLWYTNRQLSTPQIEPLPWPTKPIPKVTATLENEVKQVMPTPTPWEVVTLGILPEETLWYRQVPVIGGGLVSLLIVGLVVRISLFRRESNK